MNATGWVLFAACNVASGAIGWVTKSFVVERAELRALRQRDAEWDAAHGIRPPEAAP